ncbi:TetR/AcrR family transcriptional regulator C-terminal domain-containing protein [Sinanaerobacter chloroacetimidivorans]|jgi:probable dihydroxyacetone kinase regulator|uniref:TetR/AcrR family transcriptional regulator C-terminal domain-containing protein n=1 Tax=Sinanaerobacter chloroacetimidivorans TaxID=2818044 RepID=A0A8J7W7L1_9FIRM|nr:TetR/AcrR family transcriptional regulator C-terminal domain-containing protein [Sinanaerobacter chloroacetimidivorans]MBR0600421.1 TetR/AcrR family transcriptional regulator C-terminal domain-containing protein [Sinanaerobacter chloroacetimidivorans]
MSNSVSSNITKRILMESLKKLMASKPLNKISIRNITDDCGLNRQTFYYHFQDIYDLLQWMFEQEALANCDTISSKQDMKEHILELLKYIERNESICMSALHSLGHEHLSRFFYNSIKSLIGDAIDQIGIDLEIEEKHKNFICQYYSLSFSAIMVGWLRKEFNETPEEMAEMMDLLAHDSVRQSLERLHSIKE